MPLIGFIVLLLFTFPAKAEGVSSLALTPETFNAAYGSIAAEYAELREKLPDRYEKPSRGARPLAVPRKYREARERFLELGLMKKEMEPVHELKESLAAMFFREAPEGADRDAVELEATRIAAGVLGEVSRLREKYRLFFIPIVHNMMIDVGIKKRGACKHWAADLLKYLRKTERTYFSVTWGEAHERTFMEHNVAVIFPVHGRFEDGLMIDPWRTGGKAVWIRVTEDPHYNWHKWPLYGIY